MAVDERPDDDMLLIIRNELGRHRLDFRGIEHIEEESRDRVVTVVPERYLGRADLACDPVEYAPSEPRAERAHPDSLRHDPVDDAVDIIVGDDALDIPRLAELPDLFRDLRSRELAAYMDSDESEVDRSAPSEAEENVHEAVAVLAS